MKCKVFTGTWFEAQDAFNQWAKGKALSRDVIIHTIPLHSAYQSHQQFVAIFVYHPEGQEWDKTETTHTKEDMIEQHIAGHESAMVNQT